MDLITIATAVMAVTPLLGWAYKVVTDRITANKEETDRKMEQMDIRLLASHSREDAHREFNRIDRDVTNLQTNVNKGFDRLYETVNLNKEELLQAIHELRTKK